MRSIHALPPRPEGRGFTRIRMKKTSELTDIELSECLALIHDSSLQTTQLYDVEKGWQFAYVVDSVLQKELFDELEKRNTDIS